MENRRKTAIIGFTTSLSGTINALEEKELIISEKNEVVCFQFLIIPKTV